MVNTYNRYGWLAVQACVRSEVPVQTCQIEELELKEEEGETLDVVGVVRPLESAYLNSQTIQEVVHQVNGGVSARVLSEMGTGVYRTNLLGLNPFYRERNDIQNVL